MCNPNYRAWWKCFKCKGEYQQEVQSKVIIKKTCPYCTNHKVLEGLNDPATTHEYLLNEQDYLNNILLAKPTEIDENRYKIQVKEWHIESEIKRHVRFAKDTEENKSILFSLQINKLNNLKTL